MSDRFRLIRDNDCHWYVIPIRSVEEFLEWCKAMEECRPWSGRDFDECRVDDYSSVTFSDWKE